MYWTGGWSVGVLQATVARCFMVDLLVRPRYNNVPLLELGDVGHFLYFVLCVTYSVGCKGRYLKTKHPRAKLL